MNRQKPKRSETPEQLSDTHLWCHLHGHDWDDPPLLVTNGKPGAAQSQRKDHECDRGCVCTLGYWVDPLDGQRWGFKRGYPDWYGLDGGWSNNDLRAEQIRREAGGAQIKPKSRRRS